MARPRDPSSAPRRSGGRRPTGPLGWGLLLLVAGTAGGAALVVWTDFVNRAFGHDPAADPVLALVVAIGVGLGVHLPPRRRGRGASGPALIALGVATAVFAHLGGGPASALAVLGAGVDAGAWVIGLSRALVGGLLLGPLGFAVGASVRRAVTALPEGARGAGLAAWAATGGALGVLAADLAAIRAPGPPAALPTAAGITLVAVGIIALRAGRQAPLVAPDEPAPPPPGPAPILMGIATGFLVAVGAGLAWRTLVPAFGNSLPDVPLGSALFAAGAAGGALLATVLATLVPRVRGLRAAGPWTIAGAIALLVHLRFPDLPARFVASLADAGGIDALVRTGLRLAAPAVLPAAFAAGAAAASLAAGAPGGRAGRPGWVARAGAGTAAGVVAGIALSRIALPALDLGALVRVATVIAGLLGATTVFLAGGRLVVRGSIAAALAIAVAAGAALAPGTARDGLWVERDLVSSGSPYRTAPKSWIGYDVDDPAHTWTVVRRGHQRRLLVDGRSEMGDETGIKSQGLLAHLPLLVHPQPSRVLLIGPANAYAIGAALSHPVSSVDCIATSRAEVRATARFGVRTREPLLDPRLHFRIGDPAELLARAPGYDVILDEVSGAWTERSARTATREFLELVRDRLGADGVYARWVPTAALTKEGFLTLLGTVASVFPRVEVWSGQAGDVVLLAKCVDEPHDFGRVLAAYRDPRVAAGARRSWLGDPLTLLSQFLVGDTKVRGITRGHSPHTLADPRLGREEADRRLRAPTVDPTPGLVALRDDVTTVFSDVPGEGFSAAVANAVRARDLERTGLELEQSGREDDAVLAYRQGLELNPDDGALRRALAVLRSLMGIRYTNAQAFMAAHSFMREAVEVDSTYAEGFANLGALLLMNDSYDYAVAVTGHALQLAPDDDIFLAQMGRIWKRRGYFDKALEWFTKALEVNPRNVEAAIGYIDSKLALEDVHADLQEGYDFLVRFLEYEPDNERLQLLVGKLRNAIDKRLTRPEDEGEPGASLGEIIEEPGGGEDAGPVAGPEPRPQTQPPSADGP